jgi:branched-chain amino acid aminotransferase
VRIHLNGRLVDEGEAVVSIFDRGFLFGDGVFESMRAYGARVFRLPRHLDRLARSADLVGIVDRPSAGDLSRAVAEVLEANALRDARIRLTLTRGPGRPGDYVGADGPSTVVISATPFAGIESRLFEEGVSIVLSSRQAIPAGAIDPAIKSISRIASVLARREAHQAAAFESVLLDARGSLTEGTASNIFLVRGDRLLTPASEGGALPGVTREAVLQVAVGAALEILEQDLPAALLREVDEIFLTNTSWEVLPVVRVDGDRVADGRPGPVALGLLARYRDLVRLECGRA